MRFPFPETGTTCACHIDDEFWIVFPKYVFVFPVNPDTQQDPEIIHFPFTWSSSAFLIDLINFGDRENGKHVGILANNGALSMWRKGKEGKKELFRIRIRGHRNICPNLGDFDVAENFTMSPSNDIYDVSDELPASIGSTVFVESKRELWILWNNGTISGVLFVPGKAEESWDIYPTFELPPRDGRLHMLYVPLDGLSQSSSFVWCFGKKLLEIINADTFMFVHSESRSEGLLSPHHYFSVFCDVNY